MSKTMPGLSRSCQRREGYHRQIGTGDLRALSVRAREGHQSRGRERVARPGDLNLNTGWIELSTELVEGTVQRDAT